MTKGEFYSAFLKIVKRYDTGKKEHYPPEVMKLIFEEVEMLPLEWFERLVTKLIANERFAPLLPIFKEHAKNEKRRLIPIRTWANGPSTEFSSIYTDEERREMLDIGKNVARGLLSADLANEYISTITKLAYERKK